MEENLVLGPAKVGKTLLNLGLRGKMFHVERLFDCVLNSDPPLEVAFEFRFCIIPDPLECSTWNLSSLYLGQTANPHGFKSLERTFCRASLENHTRRLPL